ncbi:uracil-DNA glycosylase [Sphingomonas sp. FW199]|uniref:uracil-DNA glycosylase n=1 Tax=Sphingomonas sp. FW199 TaxID=3400217 RepID=UPI003CF3A9E5
MGADTDHRWHDVAASALEWWADAGVDQLVEETAGGWIAPPVPAMAAAPAAPAAIPVSDSPLPGDWASYIAWRLGPDAPDAAWPGRIVPPSGPVDAEWLILSDVPESEDVDGPLSSGAVGRLTDNILAAIGIDRTTAHIATLAVKAPATGQIPAEQLPEFGRIAHHLLAISGVRRVLVFGQATSRALFGINDRSERGRLRAVNHDARKLAIVATHAPRFMVERPRVKGEVWRDIQSLMRGLQ